MIGKEMVTKESEEIHKGAGVKRGTIDPFICDV